MSTFTPTKLAFVQLPNTKGDIYDPGSNLALVHNIILHNANTTVETVTLYLHDGTNEYILYKVSLAVNETLQLSFAGEGLVVNDASKITGLTTTAAKVTCNINGSVVTA